MKKPKSPLGFAHRRATAALVAVTIPLLFLPAARPARAAEWLEFAKLAAADPGGVDRFGYGVAIWGERIAVGAPFDNSPSGDAGSVSVFERDADGVRFLAATLTASDAGESWNLGTQVAIWGDTVAATAPGADPGERGAVYVFERNGEGVWRETAKLIAPDGALFASSVTVSGDTLVVGRAFTDAGAAYVFERDAGGPGRWGPVAKLTPSDGQGDDRFGGAVALDGDRLVVGARQHSEVAFRAGAAYIFERDAADEWSEVVKLTASDGTLSDRFGQSVALDGDTLVVGAFFEGPGDSTGAAYVFEHVAPGVWIEVAKLTASDRGDTDLFGGSVGIAGDLVVAGAEGKDFEAIGFEVGAAYLFARDHGGPGQWGEVAKLTASDAVDGGNFGVSVAVSGRRVVVGSEGAFAEVPDAGAGYVFLEIEPKLAVVGACPGTVALALTGATPSQPVALLGALAEGSAVVPSGPCAATEVGLAKPKLLAMRRADADGKLSLIQQVGAGVCGRFLQALDGLTCEVSGVEQLP